MLSEKKIFAIMNEIEKLEPGQSTVYFKGKSCWMSDMDERMQKKLQEFLAAQASKSRVFFSQRRLSEGRLSEYEYIATKSRRLFN